LAKRENVDRAAAAVVATILKGVKRAELSVQQPAAF
jgi:hypothetical protein